MAIIIASGSARGVGKTTLVCGLIRTLNGLPWTAVKITSDPHKGLPPIYEERVSGPDTDTARYLAAGAERAFLLTIPTGRDLAEALDEFWPHVGRGSNLIFESNRAVHHVRADLCLLVQGHPDLDAGKPSYYRVAPLGDAVVVQGDSDLMVADGEMIEGQLRGPVFNLKQLDSISGEMKKWLLARLALAV